MNKEISSIIINADDFGISPGVNQAIIDCYLQGRLNSASIFAQARYSAEAIRLWREKCPQLSLGLHLNLCYGKAVLPAKDIPLLVSADGSFRYGFVALLLQTIFRGRSLRAQIHAEIVAQIEKLQSQGVRLTHLDGHRHVQMIPAVYSEVLQIAQRYQIPRIRVINEDLRRTMRIAWDTKTFFPISGLVKYMLLRFLAWCCRASAATAFFSVLYTCAMTSGVFAMVLSTAANKQTEIMLHPGCPALDKDMMQGDPEYQSLISAYRDVERDILLQESSR